MPLTGPVGISRAFMPEAFQLTWRLEAQRLHRDDVALIRTPRGCFTDRASWQRW